MAQAERPDLIILDLLMAGVNGFEGLDPLGRSPIAQGLPIILFTVTQLTVAEKQRVKGRIRCLVQKETFFTPEGVVGIVRAALKRTLKGHENDDGRTDSDS